MSERFHQLSARHRTLRLRSAQQRQELANAAQDIEASLEPVDRGINTLRRLAKNPALLVAGVAVVALVGPRRLLNLAARAAVMLPTAREVLRLTRK